MNASAPAGAPFVGLRPFNLDDHRWFYGRARETAALVRQVRGSRFTAVVGGSGSGKSSLVRAGVLVDLITDGWVPIVAKPGSAPIARLAAALSEQAQDSGEDPLAQARNYRFGATLRASAYGLCEIVEKLAPAAPRLALVIDQFEELFRYGEEARGVQKAALQEESRAFVELLLTAAYRVGARLHVVITMRSDYFGSCASYAGLAEAVSASQYLVPSPSRDQLEEAIRGPCAGAGAEIDDALVQRLLIDVEEQVDRLPLLQHTLRRLWDLAHGEPRHLGERDYVTIGGLAGSINRQAEQVAQTLVVAHVEDGATLERLMKALTNLDEHDRATRRPQRREELLALLAEGSDRSRAAASLDRVIAAFSAEGTSFLQVGEGDDPEVDIGHEALIRGWKRLAGEGLDFKTGWLRVEREDGEEWRGLVRRAESGGRLGLGDQRRISWWMKRRALSPAWSARYGNAWEPVHAMRRRSRRLTTVAFAGLALALVVLVGLGWAAWIQRQRAEREALRQARAGSLAAAVAARAFGDRGDARVGALVALGVLPEGHRVNDPRFVPEVEGALANALSHPVDVLRFQGQDVAVYGIAFSPDGHRVAAAAVDKTVRLWDAGTGQAIGAPLRGHDAAVWNVAFSPDGRRLASASEDKTVRLWDVATGQAIGAPLRGHDGAVWGVAFSPDGRWLASASADKTVKLWDATTGQAIAAPLRGHDGAVSGVAFSPDGRRVASGSEDKTVRLWDVRTGQAIGSPLRGHDAAVYGVVFSPDGRRLASGSWDRTIWLWDVETGQAIGSPLRGHDLAVWGLAFSPDGRQLASASEDKTVRLWDAGTGKPIGSPLRGHVAAIWGLAFSPDGRRLVSASEDKTARLWDVAAGASGSALRGHDAAVWGVAFSPDGQLLASASWDRTLRLWDTATTQAIRPPLRGHDGLVWRVAFSPNGQRLASASADKTVRLWDVPTGQTIGSPLQGHFDEVYSVAFSPDGQRLASGSKDRTVRLWDVGTGQAIGLPLRGHDAAVWGVAFSPDGRRLASASVDKMVQLWDVGTGQPIGPPLRGHDGGVVGIAFSPDGQRLATASVDKTVRLWDAATGRAVGSPLRGHDAAVYGIAYSPDGRRLASASWDKTVRLWDARTGEAIGAPLLAHDGQVNGIAFSPDGRRWATASSDKTVRLWDGGPVTDPLAELVARAELLCPLSRAEREALHLLDPLFAGQEKALTDPQRRACGEPMAPAKP